MGLAILGYLIDSMTWLDPELGPTVCGVVHVLLPCGVVCVLSVVLIPHVCVCTGLTEVGIYRVAGVMRDLDELSKAFDTGD